MLDSDIICLYVLLLISPVDYVTKLMDRVVEYCQSSEKIQSSADHLPPPLSIMHERPSKSDAISENRTRFSQ